MPYIREIPLYLEDTRGMYRHHMARCLIQAGMSGSEAWQEAERTYPYC
jgi:hypothetical protein